MQRQSLRQSSIICSTVLAFALPCVACGATSSSDEYTGGAVASGGSAGTGSLEAGTGATGATVGCGGCYGFGSMGGTGGSSGTSGSGGKAIQIPVRSLPGLVSITFFERTGGSMPTPYTFLVDGPELTGKIADPVGESAFDIPGAPTEFYDVYYSDEQGELDADGSYLTISGVFGMTSPWGGGLNLAEIALNFSGKPSEYGNYVASFVSRGDNKDDASVEKCIDGDLQTETTMGNTVDSSDRLRLTLGFLSSSGPPPIK